MCIYRLFHENIPNVIAVPTEIQNNFGIRLKGTGYFMIAPVAVSYTHLRAHET